VIQHLLTLDLVDVVGVHLMEEEMVQMEIALVVEKVAEAVDQLLEKLILKKLKIF
jgi:hypothetical protein